MNELLIYNWNSTVSDEDIVIFLGDFALGRKEEIAGFIQRLNGKKSLVRGNHDHASDSFFIDNGFEIVYKKPTVMKLGEHSYICSHAPVEVGDYEFNIHGHTHGMRSHDRNHYCACVELNDYKPVNIKTIEEYFKPYGL